MNICILFSLGQRAIWLKMDKTLLVSHTYSNRRISWFATFPSPFWERFAQYAVAFVGHTTCIISTRLKIGHYSMWYRIDLLESPNPCMFVWMCSGKGIADKWLNFMYVHPCCGLIASLMIGRFAIRSVQYLIVVLVVIHCLGCMPYVKHRFWRKRIIIVVFGWQAQERTSSPSDKNFYWLHIDYSRSQNPSKSSL